MAISASAVGLPHRVRSTTLPHKLHTGSLCTVEQVEDGNGGNTALRKEPLSPLTSSSNDLSPHTWSPRFPPCDAHVLCITNEH